MAVDTILRRYPDYGKATDGYVQGVFEYVVTLTQEQRDRLADVKTGIATVCRFMPTVAEIADFLRPKVDPDKVLTEGDRARARDLADRVAATRSTPLPEPGRAPVYFDKAPYRYEWQKERTEIDEAKLKESMARTDRMTRYVRWLGDGDGLKGWELATELDITEPPHDWKETDPRPS